MSSSDRGLDVSRTAPARGIFGLARAAGLAALVLGLSACTVRPVYMQQSGSTQNVAADLSAVDVSGVGTRVGQEVRNNLLFAFTGGRPPPPAKYLLIIEVESAEERLGFEKDETAPSYQVTVRVRFELQEIASGRSILRSDSMGMASYDRSNQNFANQRARIDAENRAAREVANEIQLRLALAAARQSPVMSPTTTGPAGPNLPASAVPRNISNQM